MKKVLLLSLLLVSSVAFSQTNVRVRGTITSLDGNVLSVKSRDGRDLQLQLTPDATVVASKATTLADLKPGTYVGSTSKKRPDGSLEALEVHTLAPQVPPGHIPWDLEPGTSMTNANLGGIARVSGGEEITLDYPGGSQKIVVPPGTPIVLGIPGSRDDLKPGETIFAGARQEADGRLVVQRIQVSKDGVRPPH